MKYRKLYTLLSLLLAALLLAACGTAAPASVSPAGTEENEPAAAPTATVGEEEEAASAGGENTGAEEEAAAPEEELPEGAVAVSTVDELLAALAPNTVIVLREGEYDLSTASDYGDDTEKNYYRWELVYGGCQLELWGLDGLQLIGQGDVTILARPRQAEVLHLHDCWRLRLEGLTLGHSLEAGPCSAGVLGLDGCEDVTVQGCRLFGCGYEGVTARSCSSLFVRQSRIDGCTGGAVDANGCRDLRLEDCELCDNGQGKDAPGGTLVYLDHCVGAALVNCQITGNRVYRILCNRWSSQVSLLGCQVADNRVLESLFLLEGRSVTVDKCSFSHRSSERYYPEGNALFARDVDGEDLISFDLDHMEFSRAEYDGPAEEEQTELGTLEMPEGIREVHVKTVDEFLSAIAPDTCIVLEEGEYDLSSASDYGGKDTKYYRWDQCYDGYSLWIKGVKNLWILGAGKDQTLVSATPRYAAVIFFVDCENLGLAGFTAGHSEEPGYCAGDVLDLDGCGNISITDCGFFGCGVIGICAWNCDEFIIRTSEIYECSYSGANFTNCQNVRFEGCSIQDCDDGNDLMFLASSTVSWDGEKLGEGWHRFDGSRWLGGVERW